MFGRKGWAVVVLGALTLAAPARAGGDELPTGFVDQVYRGPDGSKAKYVVFVPHGYDGKKAFPLILFLHGAGQTGTDGRAQVRGALGRAIRKREPTFPF